MGRYTVGDLVLLSETVEWDDAIALKGEICIITQLLDNTDPHGDNFFDYRLCAPDGVVIDVWHGEIKKLEDAKEI